MIDIFVAFESCLWLFEIVDWRSLLCQLVVGAKNTRVVSRYASPIKKSVYTSAVLVRSNVHHDLKDINHAVAYASCLLTESIDLLLMIRR